MNCFTRDGHHCSKTKYVNKKPQFSVVLISLLIKYWGSNTQNFFNIQESMDQNTPAPRQSQLIWTAMTIYCVECIIQTTQW